MTRTARRSQASEADFPLIPPHGEREVPRNYSFQGPQKWDRLFELIYSDSRTPYQARTDVMRGCIHIGLERMVELIGGDIATGIWYQLRMMHDIVEQAREINDFVESVEGLQKQVDRFIERGLRESAVGAVYAYRDQAKRLPDQVLARKIVADVNKRFKWLLSGKQGRKEGERPTASLGSPVGSDESEDAEE